MPLTYQYPRVSPQIGTRLAAFSDGEAHFEIARVNADKSQATYSCRFIIKLRDDDLALLERFREAIGLGAIRIVGGGGPTRRTRFAQARWSIHRKAECLRLTEIFDEHPLWSKKASDYAIWREAVISWCAIGAHNGPADWTELERAYRAIRDARLHPLDRLEVRA